VELEILQPEDYTLEYLQGKTVKDLREICRRNNIRPGRRKKGELTLHIYNVLSHPSRHVQRDVFKESLERCFSVGAPHHDFYRNTFNSIDQHNRYWYSFKNNYKVEDYLLLCSIQNVDCKFVGHL